MGRRSGEVDHLPGVRMSYMTKNRWLGASIIFFGAGVVAFFPIDFRFCFLLGLMTGAGAISLWTS
jgi:hypothetical protein